MYEIEFSQTAEKQLLKLDQKIQIRIISTLERVRIRPYPHVKKLVGSPYFRLRVGDYRVILDIKEDKLIIYVIEVGHRKHIYN
ncbi:MAG TPA: type II toxin-antitoxin system RelE/ParE family toxin [Candidatus Nanoarchaeia archaeon]|nr:type II toxin-antitoxin system RelE/ParE family toxin [Candidatus Nanoarchaeia archaeon]